MDAEGKRPCGRALMTSADILLWSVALVLTGWAVLCFAVWVVEVL